MTRITLALAVALAALVAAAPIAARPSASAATSVTVTMKEFKFTLSKTKVPHGSVTFKLVNKGKLSHDFAIAGKKSKLIQAGKTGTLTKPAPDGPFYTWFVGFAPSRKPEVAISVLVANHLKWRVKAPNVAADMLRVVFADRNAPGVTDPTEHSQSSARR